MAAIIKKSGRILLLLIVLSYCIRLVIGLSQGVAHSTYGWDFRTYYYGAKAYQEDKNPYDYEVLKQEAGPIGIWPFIYPPPALWFFNVFTFLSFPAAAKVWLFLRLAMIVILVFLWRKYFNPSNSSIVFYLMLLFAFDAAIFWDFKAGNVSIVEQFFLWMGLLFLLKKRPIIFCAFILLASIFKVTPILFLWLLPLSSIRNKWKYFIGASVAVSALAVFCYMISPVLVRDYIVSIVSGPRTMERAVDFNYALLPFWEEIVLTVGSLTHTAVPLMIARVLYALSVIAVLWITAATLGWRHPSRICRDPRLLIMLGCVVYVLLIPRIKCYSYIIMIVPTYYIMMEYLSAKAYPFIFLLTIIPVHNPLPEDTLILQYRLYYLLFATLAVWILYLHYIRKGLVHPPGDAPPIVSSPPESGAPV